MIRTISTGVAFVVGAFMLAQYFIEQPIVVLLYGVLLDYYQIIFALTMIVGGITLFRHHLKRTLRFDRGALYSGITIAALLFMVLAAIIFGTEVNSPFQWAFHNLQAPMQSTTFALLGFFVASAAFRGFRIRSGPAILLAAAALLVLLGRSVFGELISDYLPQLTQWMLSYPSVAAKRGILIGIGLGSVATALRVILGIERSYL